MNEEYDPEAEERNLEEHWDELEEGYLDSYLVSGVEDPRINVQSILTRSLIADWLWPGEFSGLVDEELRFGAVMTWVLRRLQAGWQPAELLRHIRENRDCPDAVHRLYSALEDGGSGVPNYISAALSRPGEGAHIPRPALNVFRGAWQEALQGREAEPFSVLEPACGSANDYRSIHGRGLADYIHYSGFDIAPANIRNASERFPGVDFFVDSIMDCGVEDDSYDCAFVHDVFEHLSVPAMRDALAEVCRTTRREAWLHFFNAEDRAEHRVKPVEDYYRNLLSVPRLVESLEELGREVQVIAIPRLLEEKFGLGGCYYNQQAVTLLAAEPE